jgi:carbamoylphosphate synthase large subunit
MRWSGFNNTVVMGGFVWGVLVSIIVYFLLNKSIQVYRVEFFEFCNKYSLLKWLTPSSSKKSGVIRLSGLVGFAVIFGGVFLIIGILIDPIAKKAAEYTLSQILHKNVKIEKFNTSFLKAKLNIQGLYIDDIKTDEITLKLSWYYLFWKKFDIESLIVKNIHTQKSIKALVNLKKEAENKTTFNNNKINITLPKPEQLISGYQLESLQKIEKLKNDYEEFMVFRNEIKKIINNDKTQISSIKKEIENLDRLSKNIKSLDDIQEIIVQIEKIKKEVNSIKKDLNNRKNKLLTLKQQIIQDLDEIKKASNRDYEKLAKKYNLLKSGKYYQFAQSFFQPKIKTYVNKLVKYYEIIKPYLSDNKKNEQQYIRQKGVYIKYTDNIKFPAIIKPIDLSGGKGIKIINSHSELELAKDNILEVSKSYVVEEFIKGEHFSYFCFIYNKDIILEFLAKEYFSKNKFLVQGAIGHINNLLILNKIRKISYILINELNLKDGILHFQFVIKDNDIFILEVTRRIPGDLYIRLIELSLGVNLSENIVRLYTDKPLNFIKNNENKIITRHCVMSNKNGVFEKVLIKGNLIEEYFLKKSGEKIKNYFQEKIAILFFKGDNFKVEVNVMET